MTLRKTLIEAQQRAQRIKLLLLDVDGVMTDGRIYLDNEGNELKSFYVRDGYGIKMAQSAGLIVAIITGRKSHIVEKRAQELGISDIYQGVKDKVDVYKTLLSKYNYKDDNVAFMGDDIIDLPLLAVVGLPAAPADADEMILKCALFVSRQRGGQGAVREFIEFILKSSQRWNNQIEDYCA
jgi:3-deoxy-D-manno-octulosonate 8-phosphate phosphatase (KDO 8-P phosphatase)